MSERFGYVYESAMASIKAMAKEYGAPEEVPDRLKLKAQGILGAKDGPAAEGLRRRALQAAQVHYLSQWSKGLIPGKETPQTLEKASKEAERLADFLEEKGEGARAQEQRARAAKIKERLGKSQGGEGG